METEKSLLRIPLVIEQVEDGSLMATSPRLDGLIILADTIEEMQAIAPGIARALIEAKQEHGDVLDLQPEPLTLPLETEILLSAG
jgi:predicted RNase H-like HicB family nuclease